MMEAHIFIFIFIKCVSVWVTSTRYNMYNIQCPTDALILKKDVPARAVSLTSFLILIMIRIRREM